MSEGAEPARPAPPAALPAPPDQRADRAGQRPGLAAGLILTITLIAFENLGVITALPLVEGALRDLELYRWAVTAPLLASLVGIAVAGREVDRRGPAGPFAVGLALFAAGLVVAGTAPDIKVVVVGRLLQGLGAGAIPPTAYAAIGRAFAERARARMFALLSTAWILPGLFGPALGAVVATTLGWRWVFLGILPLVAVTAAIAVPALARLGPPAGAGPGGTAAAAAGPRIRQAAVLAAATAVALAGTSLSWAWDRPPVAVAMVAGGVALGVRQLRRLLPPGTLRLARGLPAVVGARGLQTFAFFGAEVYIPLALKVVRREPAVVAGLALTASTLTWTAGAWLQDRRGLRWGRRVMVRRGCVLLAAGIAVTATTLLEPVPVAVAALGWAVAGLGMGMSYSGLSLMALAEAPAGEEAAATSSLQLADVWGMVLGTGLGGSAVALPVLAPDALGWGVAAAFGLALVAAVGGWWASRRLPEVGGVGISRP